MRAELAQSFTRQQAARLIAGPVAVAAALTGARSFARFPSWAGCALGLAIGSAGALALVVVGRGYVHRAPCRPRWGRAIPILCAAIIVGGPVFFSAVAARRGLANPTLVAAASGGQTVRATGRLVSDLAPARWGHKVDVSLTSITDDGGTHPVATRAAMIVPARLAAETDPAKRLEAGTPFEAVGRLTLIKGEDLQIEHRSVGQLSVVEIVKTGSSPPWLAASNSARDYLEAGAAGHLSDVDTGLLLGLMYGDTRRLPADVAAMFRSAGLSHLTAVSGENFAMVIGAVYFVAKRLRALATRRRSRTAVLIAASIAFAVLARWEPSVLRAGAMALVLCAAKLVGARLRLVETISLAVAALLIVDPLLIFSLGFQLSLGATLGIGTTSIPLVGILKRRLRLPRALALPLAVAIAAEASVAPLIWWRFGNFQLYAVPANLAVVPVAGATTVAGILTCALVPLMPFLALPLHTVDRICLGWISGVARLVAHLPCAELILPHFGWPVTALLYAALIGASFGLRRQQRRGQEQLAQRFIDPTVKTS